MGRVRRKPSQDREPSPPPTPVIQSVVPISFSKPLIPIHFRYTLAQRYARIPLRLILTSHDLIDIILQYVSEFWVASPPITKLVPYKTNWSPQYSNDYEIYESLLKHGIIFSRKECCYH